MLKAITFDMGETLEEMHPPQYQRMQEVCETLGLSCSVPQVREALSRAWVRMSRVYATSEKDLPDHLYYGPWLEELGVRENLEARVIEVSQALAGSEYRRTLAEGLGELLAELRRRGLVLGIISNWSPDLVDYCREIGIAGYFQAILASEAVGVRKPNPRIFQMALERLEAKPEEVLHVGDNYYADVQGPQAIGMEAILIDRHGLFPQAKCKRISKLGELLEHLQ